MFIINQESSSADSGYLCFRMPICDSDVLNWKEFIPRCKRHKKVPMVEHHWECTRVKTKVKYLGNLVLLILLKLLPSSVRLSSASLIAWSSSWEGSGIRLDVEELGGRRIDVFAWGGGGGG